MSSVVSCPEDKYKHERLQYQANQLVKALVQLERTKSKVAQQYHDYTIICRQNGEQPAAYIERATKAYGGVGGSNR